MFLLQTFQKLPVTSPFNIYFFKVAIEILEESVKYVRS